MAKPNYSFEKRQRDIAKKKKKEEKRLKKAEAKGGITSEVEDDQPQEAQPLSSNDDNTDT
jgi:hypothetical protein|tara:strand:+ start:30353 stop:30532 length:180 start_codon:yes stop_codon:yes gene_type:complete